MTKAFKTLDVDIIISMSRAEIRPKIRLRKMMMLIGGRLGLAIAHYYFMI